MERLGHFGAILVVRDAVMVSRNEKNIFTAKYTFTPPPVAKLTAKDEIVFCGRFPDLPQSTHSKNKGIFRQSSLFRNISRFLRNIIS